MKKFTLIELIVVIAVLGILASIIVPNISNIQGKATEVAVQADVRSLQTVVDMYQLEHNGVLPTVGNSTALQASELDFSKVYPDYLRSLPKTKDIKYWVDVSGLIWSSETDMPILTSADPSSLSWEEEGEAKGYIIYEILKKGSTSSVAHSSVSYKEIQRITDISITNYMGDSNKQYAVATLDRLERSSAPIGVTNYSGYTDTLESIKKGQSNQTPPVIEQKGVAKTYIGGYASFTIMNNGTLYSAGDNSMGQLGLGDKTPKTGLNLIPNLTGVKDLTVPYGRAAYFALLEDGTVKSWGYNGDRILGFNDNSDRVSPETIQELSNVKKIYSAGKSLYALLNDGTVMSWGENTYGQLGLGNTTKQQLPTLIPNLDHVKEIVLNHDYNQVYALLEDGTVKAWGDNNRYMLGLGDYNNRLTPTTIPTLTNVQKIIPTPSSTVYALLKDGTVKAWGSGSMGQLGLGDQNDRSTPTTVPELKNAISIVQRNGTGIAIFSDGSVKIWGQDYFNVTGGYQSILSPIVYPQLTNVKRIIASVTSNAHFAILKDDTVKAWGANFSGGLGLGDTVDYRIPTLISGLSNVSDINSADNSTIAVLKDGTVKVWGSNFAGQLGLSNKTDQYIPVANSLD